MPLQGESRADDTVISPSCAPSVDGRPSTKDGRPKIQQRDLRFSTRGYVIWTGGVACHRVYADNHIVRKDRSASPAVSAALLALAVTLCTGSLAEGAAAHDLVQRSQVRVTVDQRGETVATLLACLSQVAKQLYPPQYHVAAIASVHRHRAWALHAATDHHRTTAQGRPVMPVSPVRLALLNLPPPGRG